jgi:polyisoprenoid-binding protein YceI
VVRHFVSNVRGHFDDFTATIVKDEQDPSKSSVEFTVQVASIDTGVEKRDNHLRSADFFDAATYPTLTFKSRHVEKISDSQYKVTGDLTMRGVTKVVPLTVDFAGEMPDGFGNVRAGFSTSTTIDRREFHVDWNRQLANGGYMLSDEVKVEIDLEAVKQQ